MGADPNFYTVLSQLKRNSSKEPRRVCQADTQRNTNVLKSENASDSPKALGSLSSTTADSMAGSVGKPVEDRPAGPRHQVPS